MAHEPYKPNENIVISSFVSCYYFEMSNRYLYSGEKHDFWELVYVDKGEVEADTDSGLYRLEQGDILFHSPNEYHRLRSTHTIAPNLFIVTFFCHSEDMRFFNDIKRFRLGHSERNLLAQLLKEGINAFGPNQLDLSPRNLTPVQNSPFASEQLFKNYLETLLLLLIRKERNVKLETPLPSSTRENQITQLCERIVAYIKANIHRKITLNDLCAAFNVGRTQINILFKKERGIGIIEYVNRLKIDYAKTYIREEIYNLTEISDLLGYSSVHYFSRHFKKSMGMTPSEYSKTIKSHLDAMLN